MLADARAQQKAAFVPFDAGLMFSGCGLDLQTSAQRVGGHFARGRKKKPRRRRLFKKSANSRRSVDKAN